MKKKSGFPRKITPRDRIASAPEEYVKRLKSFCDVLSECMAISRKHGGIPSPSLRYFFASVLFTSLCTRGASLAFIAPYSTWATRKFEHWDYASVANIARTMMETRLNFFYLCSEQCPQDEWDCRWNVFNLHDCRSRMELFKSMPNGADDLAGFITQAEELRQRLLNNQYFISLPEGTQRSLLNGGKAHIVPMEEIAEKAGVDVGTYRWMWKLMSAHAHALPMSFYRMGNNERGRGVQTKVEEGYTTLLLSFCITLLVHARDEYVLLMKDISTRRGVNPEDERLNNDSALPRDEK